MKKLGIEVKNNDSSPFTKVYTAVDGIYAGCLLISDEVRPGTAEALNALRGLGVKRLWMLTGDSPAIAGHVQKQVGLDGFNAGLLPQDKVSAFEKIMEEKELPEDCAAFVGDGMNDAPVLTRADLGIAMGGIGSDAAIESADAVIMNDCIETIADGMRIARRTLSIARQNIVF